MLPISICIIAKNEEKNIDRFLNAILDSMKGYEYEIVLVDTGSTDDTVRIAKKYLDNVYHFNWIDNFSAARNYSISLASNDWILVLDCDEFITQVDVSCFEMLVNQYPDAVGVLNRVNHFNMNGSKSIYTDQVERFFNRKLYNYEYIIHEQVRNINSFDKYKRVEIPLEVDHFGYNGTEEELINKVNRNNELLLKMLDEKPDDSYIYFQLGQSYNALQDDEKACFYYGKGLEYDVDPRAEYVQMMVIGYGYALVNLEKYEEALGFESIYEEFSSSADFVCLMGIIYLRNGLVEAAADEFLKATSMVNYHVEGTNTFIPFYNLGCINEVIGNTDIAIELYEKCGDFPNAKDRLLELKKLKTVVFLPYKASMWDSLESMWRKYNDNPEYRAMVIPIPYYDKNPDGTLKEYHYEGNQYPEYVPIIDYREYSIKDNHPDVVFIHNPYDEANFVTTVHPDYYSKVLKEQTDKLVYVPYFILHEVDPTNSAAIASIAHLIQTAAIFNAHEVIVQSENMRKCYIESMVQLAGEQTREVWENKIKGTGSPKLEKLLNTHIEDLIIPSEWIRKYTKADGSVKKIIFYNTSVSAFLQDSENMIKKIESVLKFFSKKTDDVTLLWRPHPLMQSTINATRTEYLNRYNQLVDWYIREDFGIYDDSADLDRAIILSDAYYGDHSSVVALCEAINKPIMIQNPYIINMP